MKVKQLKSGNILHSDGRIFVDGDGIAQTVSPYAPDFYENIEEDIKPLVSALVAKGYLTYSSCGGHQVVKRRFVAVAFPDKESCRSFIDSVRKLYNHWLIHYEIKHGTGYYFVDESNVMFHTNFLNTTIFHRGYEDYWFVEMSIGKNTPPKIGNLIQILGKTFFRDSITKKLTESISSKDFPYYEK